MTLLSGNNKIKASIALAAVILLIWLVIPFSGHAISLTPHDPALQEPPKDQEGV